MVKLNYSAKEIEEYRQDTLKRLGHPKKDFEEHFGPASFGHHEALHTAYVQLEVFGLYVMDHPSVLNDPKLYKMAHKIHEQMFELYQEISRKQT